MAHDYSSQQTDDDDEFVPIHVTPYYHSLKILKLKDSITLTNCLLVHDYINKKLPSSFDGFFTFQSEVNSMVTR